ARRGGGHGADLPFSPPASDAGAARSNGRVPGDGIEPACERTTAFQGPRPAEQNKKSRLKCVFRRVAVAQHTPTDAEHHRPMPPSPQPSALTSCAIATLR